MATLKEGDYSVDAVVSFFAMFHIDRHRHRNLLYRIRSYLQEGGIFLVTTGDSDWEGEEDFLESRCPGAISTRQQTENSLRIAASEFCGRMCIAETHLVTKTGIRSSLHVPFDSARQATQNEQMPAPLWVNAGGMMGLGRTTSL